MQAGVVGNNLVRLVVFKRDLECTVANEDALLHSIERRTLGEIAQAQVTHSSVKFHRSIDMRQEQVKNRQFLPGKVRLTNGSLDAEKIEVIATGIGNGSRGLVGTK